MQTINSEVYRNIVSANLKEKCMNVYDKTNIIYIVLSYTFMFIQSFIHPFIQPLTALSWFKKQTIFSPPK